MASQIFTDISLLANTRPASHLIRGKEMAQLPVIENAYLIIEGDRIAEYGPMSELRYFSAGFERLPIGTVILPAWCDSHTHMVYAGSREGEFVSKIKGLSYAEIAAQGGGILHSARLLNDTSEDELFRLAWARLEEVTKTGTGAVEIKSGYGLSVEGELKMLRVIKKLKSRSSLLIKATFLGAHAFPAAYRDDHQAYLALIVDKILPVIAAEKLADYIDVFCEQGFFSSQEMDVVCRAGQQYGLKPKLHVNQLSSCGGIQQGIALNAVSLDHLETVTGEEVRLLGRYGGSTTLLPTAAFFLRMGYPPARQLIEAGAAITLASDYNPGSSPSGNMNFVVALSCIQMKLLPAEAINAATINGACAMEIEKEAGSITVGKKANLLFSQPLPSLDYIPYSFGNNFIHRVMINGDFVW